MVFYIKQGATLPKLKMVLKRDSRYSYKEYVSAIENATVTFSMKSKNGVYKVANRPATIEPAYNCDGDNEPTELEYIIIYEFRPEDTEKIGVYFGEFNIVMFDTTNGIDLIGKLTMPINEFLEIHVLDSFSKVDVVQI